MIYLAPEVRSGLGEDTFWLWFEREVGGTFNDPPRELKDEDALLQYSTLGAPRCRGKNTIALLWELLPEMRAIGIPGLDARIAKTEECAKACNLRVVATDLARPFYEHCGPMVTIPIGVNTRLFRPVGFSEKQAIRQHAWRRTRSRVFDSSKIGFWCGTRHPMKGFLRLLDFAGENREITWIVVWKSREEGCYMPGALNVYGTDQHSLADLMRAADLVYCPGLLGPFFMAEWEAMASDLEVVIPPDSPKKDFIPGLSPRVDLLARGWDRGAVKATWVNWLKSLGVRW